MRTKQYPNFDFFSNLRDVLGEVDSQRAVELGADNVMNLAEYALRERPFALRRARELYIATCLQLYRAAREASQ